MNHLEQLLTKLDLSPNEAKVYASLLSQHPVNGYELSKALGITRATSYNVLDRLVEKGLVTKIEASSIQYSPVPPDLFIKRYKSDTDRTCNEIMLEFARLSEQTGGETYISHIKGSAQIEDLARETINAAQKEVVLSLWIQEAQTLLHEITQALQRGVRVIMFSYTDLRSIGSEEDTDPRLLKIHHYGLSEATASSLWNRRRLVAVSDHANTLLAEASIEQGDPDTGIFTRNPMVIQMCIEQINLDILRLKHIQFELSSMGEIAKSKTEFEKAIKHLHSKIGLHFDDLPQVFSETE